MTPAAVVRAAVGRLRARRARFALALVGLVLVLGSPTAAGAAPAAATVNGASVARLSAGTQVASTR